MSYSLWPHGLYSPWHFLGQNTGVSSLSLLQRIFPTQGSNPGLPHCGWILYQLSHKGSPRILGIRIELGIELGSSALQVDAIPTELSGKPLFYTCSVYMSVLLWIHPTLSFPSRPVSTSPFSMSVPYFTGTSLRQQLEGHPFLLFPPKLKCLSYPSFQIQIKIPNHTQCD